MCHACNGLWLVDGGVGTVHRVVLQRMPTTTLEACRRHGQDWRRKRGQQRSLLTAAARVAIAIAM
eukprot:scaffold7785_cov106-Isochrysis_galbana.AAC.2